MNDNDSISACRLAWCSAFAKAVSKENANAVECTAWSQSIASGVE